MKVRLLVDIPVDKKFGLTKGKEVDVIYKVNADGVVGYWADCGGEDVKILNYEREIVE